MKQFVVTIASDQTYLPGAIGLICSIRISLDLDVHLVVVFLHDGLSKQSQDQCLMAAEKLKGATTIEFKKISADFSRFPRFPGATQLTYARLLLPQLCDYERIIYLDVDMLVCKNLQPLMECEVSEIGLAAIVERGIITIGGDFHPNCPFQVDLSKPYFNGGLMVMDMAKIRATGFFEKALEYLNSHPEYCKVWDQSAMNYVANGRFTPLDESFNFQNSRYYSSPSDFISPLRRRDVVVHFVSQQKPWNFYSSHPPEKMFRLLLGKILPSWQSKDFKKTKVAWKMRMFFVNFHPILFKFRAFLKTLFGKCPQSDLWMAQVWTTKSQDEKELSRNRKEVEELYSSWCHQIESRLA